MRILIIESAPDLLEALSNLLTAENFAIERAVDADSGFAKASGGDFDLVILGSARGESLTDARAVCAELRRNGVDTTILMLTQEPVSALRLGADDCVSSACDANELLARVEALLRRAPRARREPADVLRFGDVEVSFRSTEAKKGGRALSLSSKELRLLQYLADHRDRVVTRKEILRNVWEYDAAISSRTVDVHIGWLRQKLEDQPQQPRYIKTIRGRGYRFDCDDRQRKPGIPTPILPFVGMARGPVKS